MSQQKVTGDQLSQVVTAMNNTYNGRFARQTDVYTKGEVDNKLTAVYKPGGSKTAAELTSALLVAANEGKVYNVTDELTTTAGFVEGAGKVHGAGVNVVVIEATPADNTDPENPVAATYKFDVLGGLVDLTDFEAVSAAEIAGIIASIDDPEETENSGE